MIEDDALSRQAIDGWCLDDSIPATSQCAIAQLVGENKEEMGFGILAPLGGGPLSLLQVVDNIADLMTAGFLLLPLCHLRG